MRDRGFSLVELMAVVGIILAFLAVSAPYLKASFVESHILGAGRIFQGEFRKARSIAATQGLQTAIRFERQADGTYFSTYVDGNHNGVRSADIRSGIDRRIRGPLPLTGGAPRVRVAINPGLPEIPPASGRLLPGDPIKFSADTLSFSPLGTATPGTFYLAGEGVQGAVRVVAGSARVRLLIWRGRRWEEK